MHHGGTEVNICFWILISLYAFGTGFFIGEYFADNTPKWVRAESSTPFEKIMLFLFGPYLAVVWLYAWIKQEFFGRKLK